MDGATSIEQARCGERQQNLGGQLFSVGSVGFGSRRHLSTDPPLGLLMAARQLSELPFTGRRLGHSVSAAALIAGCGAEPALRRRLRRTC
jgi:hypothetical protein